MFQLILELSDFVDAIFCNKATVVGIEHHHPAVVDFAVLAFDFIAQESVVKSVEVLGVGAEEIFGDLIEQCDELLLGDGFLILEGFGFLGFGINLGKKAMKVAKGKTVAEDTSIEHEHDEFRVLEEIWIGFGEISNQLVDTQNFSLFELDLFLLHDYCLLSRL